MRDGIVVTALTAWLACAGAHAQSPAASPAYHPDPQATQLDLQQPFHARTPWRLVVTEGTPVKDYGDNDAPGALTLCLQRGPSGACLPDPVAPPLRDTSDGSPAWEPHYLLTAKVVYPRGPRAAPFLLLVTASLSSGDGDQLVATQLVAYDPDHDAFRRVYSGTTGHNNNQEIRFVTDGPLRGSVITAEPQDRRPFGYWVTVEKLTPANTYRQVLRFLSATHYGDGNPLAVIDSEMPTIWRRLGLWKTGQALPVPATVGGKACRMPRLKDSEPWCE